MNVRFAVAGALLSVSFLSACATTQPVGPEDNRWLMKRIEGQPIPVNYAPRLYMTADGQLSGFAGCNQFSGAFTRSGETMSVSALTSTRKQCEPIQMQVEKKFLDFLQRSVAYLDRCGALTLTSDMGEKMVFDPERGL